MVSQGKHPIPLYFAPTTEEGNGHEERFLPDHPINIITEGKFNQVPLILGYVSEEGMFVLRGKFTFLYTVGCIFSMTIQTPASLILREIFLPQPGFEPQISWILVRRSTIELLRFSLNICNLYVGQCKVIYFNFSLNNI